MSDHHRFILEEAINRLADLPEDHKIYITSGRPEALEKFQEYIDRNSLVGVKVLDPLTIIEDPDFIHEKGLLMISEKWSLDSRVLNILYKKQQYMNSRYRE